MSPVWENIPAELKQQTRWLCWRYSDKPNKAGKFGKVPYSIADRKANYTDPSVLLPFETVMRQYQRQCYDGVGIVLGGGLVGLDEDHCITAEGMTVEARTHLEHLRTYSEVSVSRDGCHALALGSLPDGARKRGDHELYSDRRFFVVTGSRLEWASPNIEFRDQELHELHRLIFTKTEPATIPVTKEPKVQAVAINRNKLRMPPPVEDLSVTQISAYTQREGGGEEGGGEGAFRGARSDADVMEMIRADPMAARYWQGCPDGMNPSRADWALAMKLAFYTGRDLNQMDRLFRASGLCCRNKDTTRRGTMDYVRYTLERACRAQDGKWTPSTRPPRTKQPRGRKRSLKTQQVLELASTAPWMEPMDIARQLGSNDSGWVRVILHRWGTKPQVSKAVAA